MRDARAKKLDWAFCLGHRLRLRTTNGPKRINHEQHRRPRLAGILPNTESCLPRVLALLAERKDEWMTGKVYLNPNP